MEVPVKNEHLSLLPSLLFLVILFASSQLLAWFGVEIITEISVIFVILIGYYLFMLVCLVIFNRFQGLTLGDMGFKRVGGSSRLAFLGIVLGAVSSFLLVVLFGLVQWTGIVIVPPLGISRPELATLFILALILFPSLLAVAVVEEGAFRGYIQRIFGLKYGFIPALLLASLLFAVMHFPFAGIIKIHQSMPELVSPALQIYSINVLFGILPLGIFFGYVYFKTGQNLICPILFHTIHNFLLILTQVFLGMYVLTVILLAPWLSLFLFLSWIAVLCVITFAARRFLEKPTAPT